ncbi:DUF6950 family protein [Sinorhizobium americanum]|uniref:DUF6950 family protein n=1 Tax=Sinorhizobium americanum TaxID=194963 RepID=UPI0007D925CB|nr:hypothetical protein [Sinorhizobium americanum]OAP43737.1 hypothetical protein ATC00_02535 [Sinorhizobium americanum]
MTLHEFLALPHRFRWGGAGGDDCTTFCARWVEENVGVDPAEAFRGSYSTADEAQRIIEAHGGVVALFAGQVEPLGLIRVQQPETGDIGVIRAQSAIVDGKVLVGAIRFGPLWAVLTPGRVVAKAAQHVAAWRLPS